jgi:hypothetical protein
MDPILIVIIAVPAIALTACTFVAISQWKSAHPDDSINHALRRNVHWMVTSVTGVARLRRMLPSRGLIVPSRPVAMALTCFAAGILLPFISFPLLLSITRDTRDDIVAAAVLAVLIAAGCLLLQAIGLASWARAKGYHPLVGICLALFLSVLGLLILVFLPDRSKERGFERGPTQLVKSAEAEDPNDPKRTSQNLRF